MNFERPHPFVFTQMTRADHHWVSRILVVIRAKSKTEAIRKFTRWRRDEAQQKDDRT
jgi:hypothetical protein